MNRSLITAILLLPLLAWGQMKPTAPLLPEESKAAYGWFQVETTLTDSYDWEGLSGFINRYSSDCRKFQKIIQQIDFQLNIYSYLCIQKKEFTKKAVTEQNSGEKSAAA